MRGFTLVEVLVALLILAVVAAMAWQGIDAMLRSREIAAQRVDRQLRLQTVIAQWETDLQEVQDTGVVPALQFDGASLRLTRRSAQGMQLVVWSLRGDSVTRWAGPVVTRSQALSDQWMQSQQLLGNEPGSLRALTGVGAWQLYLWRGNAWSNAQSSADTATTSAGNLRQLLPSGVRLVLAFTEGSGLAGTLTRDVRLAPTS
ncbi:MAG TPA: prepilin-type N-terminal cleavage/methylation domain-containing protein [Methylibium sp.]|uniref:PulJ/GspJ family protein n=1 Tax=Methylibium sp. TaxID=2067992 RepID=UPI002DB953D0|nr:prepilin-type N-terminal cleavage/methylation domain-containing protein [Methylibium sp.]HEU4459198.1 prepilin-type N-terminal cleavage/methylation domain-containing protein [Methylibium sp.]